MQQLHLGLGVDRLNCLGKAFEPVTTSNQDVLEASILLSL